MPGRLPRELHGAGSVRAAGPWCGSPVCEEHLLPKMCVFFFVFIFGLFGKQRKIARRDLSHEVSPKGGGFPKSRLQQVGLSRPCPALLCP